MELTSGIVFSLISLVKKILSFFTDWRKSKHDAEVKQEYEEAVEQVHDATESGDLGDLIAAAHKIGEAKKRL